MQRPPSEIVLVTVYRSDSHNYSIYLVSALYASKSLLQVLAAKRPDSLPHSPSLRLQTRYSHLNTRCDSFTSPSLATSTCRCTLRDQIATSPGRLWVHGRIRHGWRYISTRPIPRTSSRGDTHNARTSGRSRGGSALYALYWIPQCGPRTKNDCLAASGNDTL